MLSHSIVSLATVVGALALSLAEIPIAWKGAVAVCIAAAYGAYTLGAVLRRRATPAAVPAPEEEGAFGGDVELKLAALSDAGDFFGASLRPDDLFRLISSRLSEIVPYSTCALYIADRETGSLKVRFAAGENARHFSHEAGVLSGSLAAKCFESGSVETDNTLESERSAQPADALKGLSSAAAAPLEVEGRRLGALVAYSTEADSFDEVIRRRLEAAAERVAPLVLSSFSFKESIDNALTDPVTGLPNERGFFLVLESQVAESHRFRDTRPLSVLALDVDGFSEFNERFGHSAGNLLLGHVASVTKAQLRQMDVLTRSSGDEFLVILPTANETVSEDVLGRLRRAFDADPFRGPSGEEFAVVLNSGTATFWRDGETAVALLGVARARKQEGKTRDGKLLFFPREH
jgi:diguanylate cyclase (GGDEF)-like protein